MRQINHNSDQTPRKYEKHNKHQMLNLSCVGTIVTTRRKSYISSNVTSLKLNNHTQQCTLIPQHQQSHKE